MHTSASLIREQWPFRDRNIAKGVSSDIVEELIVEAEWRVATNPDDRSHLLGFCCWLPVAVLICYVVAPFRRLGVATRLLAPVIHDRGYLECGCWSPYAEQANKELGGVLRYTPSALTGMRSYRAGLRRLRNGWSVDARQGCEAQGSNQAGDQV
jgi:GNAT superfamily N-acetyltransferase